MNKPETKIDQWLADADQSLRDEGTHLTGIDIRRRAARLQTARRQRSRLLLGVGLVCCLLASWRFLMPDDVNSRSTMVDMGETEQVSVKRLLAKVESIQRERELVRQKLQLVKMQRRVAHIQRTNHLVVLFPKSPDVTSRRNEDTWALLQLVSDWGPRAISPSERQQLEFFVQGFPETAAGSVAQTMLTTNRVSELLYEKKNEL